MEKSISPIDFCGTFPLYAHKIVKFSEAFEEDANLLLDRFLCVLAFPLPNDDLFDHRIEYLRCQLGDVRIFLHGIVLVIFIADEAEGFGLDRSSSDKVHLRSAVLTE